MVVQAKIWGEIVGELFFKEETRQIFFTYDSEFLKKGIEISPILMPTDSREKIISFPTLNVETFKDLPPVFSDSLPDKFGNAVLNKYLETSGRSIEDINPLERLTYVGIRGMGALEYFPLRNSNNYAGKELIISDIVEIAKDILSNKENIRHNSLEDIVHIGTSAGGARPKALIAKNNITNEYVSGDILHPGNNYTYYLLKIDGASNIKDNLSNQYGKVEYAYHKLATHCGINMTRSEILSESGRDHFLTERFDRINSEKLHTQSLNSIANMDFNNPLIHSYEQCFNTMQKLNLSQNEIDQQYLRMVFNVVARNLDDHTKNICFLMDKFGKWKLSPAYDITFAYDPTNRWLKQHQMSVNNKRNNITFQDLITVGEKFTVTNPSEIIKQVTQGVSSWKTIALDLNISPERISHIEKNLLYNFIVEPKNQKAKIKEEFTSEQKIKKAVEFHLNNKYDSKMNNISLHGVSSPLNKALIKNHEFSLTLEELKKAHQLVKNQDKNIGRRL
jgi:serine/threonine-protein kinase HipA